MIRDLVFGYAFVGLGLIMICMFLPIFIGMDNAQVILMYISTIFIGIGGICIFIWGCLFIKEFIIDWWYDHKADRVMLVMRRDHIEKGEGMKKKIGRFLCRIGLHNYDNKNLYGFGPSLMRRCKRCPARQWQNGRTGEWK